MNDSLRSAGPLCAWLLLAALCAPLARAAEPSPGILGKDGWLFYRYEFSDSVDLPATTASIDLIQRFNQVLARNGISMAVMMVPIKARIYAEHLPAGAELNRYMTDNYARMAKLLRAGQVSVVDINGPFLGSRERSGESPFYIRLDTHWSPTGAMLAAETVRAEIDADAALKNVLQVIPEEKFNLVADRRKLNTKARDLVEQLPKGSPVPEMEQLQQYSVTKGPADSVSLLGDEREPAVTLLGSSYSNAWTRFPEALRFTLQRDLLAISVGADQGSWVGMESYLRDDAFQSQKPKLLIWEMPERDMRAPPDYKYRDVRYQSGNTEWLLRAAAWVQGSCSPSTLTATVAAGGLAAGVSKDVVSGATTERDYIDLNFDRPFEKLDYLVANIATSGSKTLVLEASGVDTEARKFTVPVYGDGSAHWLKMPLVSAGKGFTRLRIFPGKSSAFEFKDLTVCRQPDDLLK